MKVHVVIRYVGVALLLNAIFMLISALISLFNGVDTGFFPLLLSCILTAILGLFPMIFVPSSLDISNKESYAIVSGSWAMSCIVGMLPYVLWGGEFNIVNSCFESVSGYTTTGSTVLNDVEALPKGLLFWRSCTHLLGGAGIVLFTLVFLPSIGKFKLSLSNVEISTIAKDNYSYRIQTIIRIVLVVYASLISFETVALKLAGMDWFDAINHSFSTIATGGFSTKNLSIAYYNNIWIEIVITIFMILAGIHFGLLFASISSKKTSMFRSEVSRFYLLSIVIGTILVTVNLWTTNTYTIVDSLRYGMFQLVSVISTTGFATVDTASWPPLAVIVILFYSAQCACAGSTTGGIKSDRILLLLKTFKARLMQLRHPNAIIRIKLNNATVGTDIVASVTTFIALYIFTAIITTVLLTAMGIDLITSFSAAIACLGNVGPGFGSVSSLGNYATLPDMAKIVCSVAMFMGRLELLGFIQLFFIKSWK